MKLVISCTGIKAASGAGKEFRLVTAWSDLGEPLESSAQLPDSNGPDSPPLGSGLVIQQSPIFHNVGEASPVSLPLGGIRLYGPRDPLGDFAMYGALYEMDGEYDSLAEDIAKAKEMSLAKTALAALAKTAYAPLSIVLDLLPALIKAKAKPDLFGQFMLSGHELNNYSIGDFRDGAPAIKEETLPLAKAFVTLRYELYP